MATVFVLFSGQYDDREFIDVFESREAAEAEIVTAALTGHGHRHAEIAEQEVRGPGTPLERDLKVSGANWIPPVSEIDPNGATRVPLDTV